MHIRRLYTRRTIKPPPYVRVKVNQQELIVVSCDCFTKENSSMTDKG